MRELKRSIARHMMEVAGVKQINKRDKENPMRTNRYGIPKKASYFSLHWKEWLDPKSSFRKSLEREQLGQASRFYHRFGKPVRAAWPCCKIVGR